MERSLIKNKLVMIRDLIMQDLYYRSKNEIERKIIWSPQLVDIDQTIDKIIHDKVSVSRFGDGEFKWIMGIEQESFQRGSTQLGERLTDVLKSHLPNHIVCIPDVFQRLDIYTDEARRYWMMNLAYNRRGWLDLLDKDVTYYNAFITRLYMHYKDKSTCAEHFCKIKGIWDDREIIFVEGEKSRLGMSNDLFNNARAIKRILAPSVNAFDKYNEIFNAVEKMDKNNLILLALGPTATIMAYDLCQCGFQAIDIGHIDIEYEWFLRRANEKIAIEDKYVNEASYCGGNLVSDHTTEDYKRQVVDKIL